MTYYVERQPCAEKLTDSEGRSRILRLGISRGALVGILLVNIAVVFMLALHCIGNKFRG